MFYGKFYEYMFLYQNFCFVSSLYILKNIMAESECLSIVLASFKHVSCFSWLKQIDLSLSS